MYFRLFARNQLMLNLQTLNVHRFILSTNKSHHNKTNSSLYISAMMQPMLQISTFESYSCSSNTSGPLYHTVTTYDNIFHI